MSRIKIKDATKPLRLRVISEEEVARTPEAERVPIYRFKDRQRGGFMGWARRNKGLRGAVEILMGDEEMFVVQKESDA